MSDHSNCEHGDTPRDILLATLRSVINLGASRPLTDDEAAAAAAGYTMGLDLSYQHPEYGVALRQLLLRQAGLPPTEIKTACMMSEVLVDIMPIDGEMLFGAGLGHTQTNESRGAVATIPDDVAEDLARDEYGR